MPRRPTPIEDAPPVYEKTSSYGPAQFTGKVSTGPGVTRSWNSGSYSPLTGRGARVGEGAPRGAGQVPSSGEHTHEPAKTPRNRW